MVSVAEERTADSNPVLVLLTVREIASSSSSVNIEETSMSRSASSSISVLFEIGFASTGQSFMWVIWMVTVVVFPKLVPSCGL